MLVALGLTDGYLHARTERIVELGYSLSVYLYTTAMEGGLHLGPALGEVFEEKLQKGLLFGYWQVLIFIHNM